MNDKRISDGQKLARSLTALTDDERAKANERQVLEAEPEHDKFRDAFGKGECYICGKGLDHFDREQPCLHWLLKPTGIEKTDLPAVAAVYGAFQVQAYLRWVANTDGFARRSLSAQNFKGRQS